MKIAILQLNATVGDFATNSEKVLTAYAQALQQGAQLVTTPELFLCGYPPRDLLLRSDFVEASEKALKQVAQKIGEVPLLLGGIERNNNLPGRPLFNAAFLLQAGHLKSSFHKCLLPTYDVFDEMRYFEPGNSPGSFELLGHHIGVTICEDIWNDEDFWPQQLYRRDPIHELIQKGADIIINLSASPWHVGKEQTRIAMLQRLAQDEHVSLVQTNSIGGNDELIFDGHSLAISSEGSLVHVAPGFSEAVHVVELPPTRSALSSSLKEFPSQEETLFQALSLGIQDYVHKCGFHSVVLGLSGGIDSAVVACLAASALGPEQVLGVSMPSKYSSQGSQTHAEALASQLAIHFQTLPIAPAVALLENQLDSLFDKKIKSLTEENLQSRLRGLLLMALSNQWGYLVLNTGNKSELAVGYCTLYGDMCGALSVLSDVFKTDVYRLAQWINRHEEIIPEATLSKPPSAELRPEQTDQDSLPPYPTLDAILHRYLVEQLPPNPKEFPPSVLQDVLHKVTTSEYKRRQAAPGLKVSPLAFGMGRRIPIAHKFLPPPL